MPSQQSDAKPLYANFLENKGLYTRAQNYWQAQFDELFVAFDHEYETYHEQEEKRDGDPIYAAYFPTMQRAVRIVQRPPKDETLKIQAHLQQDHMGSDSKKVHELVIELVLSKQGANLARQLIRQWIMAFLPADKMEKEIGKRLP